MRVFVAGATGAIGRQLVPRLVAEGHGVHGMTRSGSKRAMLCELGAAPVVADALDPVRVQALLDLLDPMGGGVCSVPECLHRIDSLPGQLDTSAVTA
jgi:nucleoside-diphosphate-sugar epimerase